MDFAFTLAFSSQLPFGNLEDMEGIQVSAYNVGSSGDIALLQVGGYIDNVTSAHLEVAVDDVITHGMSKVIVDLANVNYISSAGWGVFLGRIKGLREKGGDLVFAQMIPDVEDVFELLEFHRVLKVFETTEEALSHFERTMPGGEGGREGKWTFADPRFVAKEGEHVTTEADEILHEKDFPFGSVERRLDEQSQEGKGAYPKKLLTLTEGERVGDRVVAEERAPLEEVGRGEEKFPGASFYDSLGMSRAVMDRDLPLTEKIKLLVIDNPLPGAWKIRNTLNSSRFGYIKVSVFEVRRILKELELDTKDKRYRFWRSR
jgi:anti-sigma B factor antagonist